MKSIILFLLFVGIIMIIIGEKNNSECLPKIEYRYIPRDFTLDQYQQIPILSTYGKLFTNASPWEYSIGYPSTFYRKKEEF